MKNLLLLAAITFFVGLQVPTNAQWFAQNVSSQNYLRDIFALDENTAIAVGSDYNSYNGIILKTIDGGENWVDKSNDTVLYNSSVFFINADTGWIAGGNRSQQCSELLRILKTTNAGDTLMSNTIGFGGVNSVYFTDQFTGWVVGTCYDGEMTIGIMYKTTDGGINWYSPSLYVFNYDFGFSTVYFVNKDTGFIAGFSAEGSIFKTTDGGENWTSHLNNSYCYSLNSVYFVDDSIGWAAGSEYNGSISQGVIFKTTNQGETWTTQAIGVTNILDDIFFINENTGWTVGGDGIILKTTDGGENWIDQSSGTTNNLYSVHFIDENTGWTVGENGTILKTTNGGVTYIEEEEFEEIPNSYILNQNYPNPFNPTTTIKYSIPQFNFVTLKVYDVLGNKIASFVNQEKTAGNYTIEFNAANLSSGVYFYRLQAGLFVETKKMLLLK